MKTFIGLFETTLAWVRYLMTCAIILAGLTILGKNPTIINNYPALANLLQAIATECNSLIENCEPNALQILEATGGIVNLVGGIVALVLLQKVINAIIVVVYSNRPKSKIDFTGVASTTPKVWADIVSRLVKTIFKVFGFSYNQEK